MKTIRTFLDPIEANIVRGRLESEGIPALLIDENTVNTFWIYAQAIGGVRLQVQEEHVEQALAILDHDSAKMYLLNDEQDIERNKDISCPKCNSLNVSLNKFSKSAFGFSWLLLGFPILVPDKKYHCFNCGEDWRK